MYVSDIFTINADEPSRACGKNFPYMLSGASWTWTSSYNFDGERYFSALGNDCYRGPLKGFLTLLYSVFDFLRKASGP